MFTAGRIATTVEAILGLSYDRFESKQEFYAHLVRRLGDGESYAPSEGSLAELGNQDEIERILREAKEAFRVTIQTSKVYREDVKHHPYTWREAFEKFRRLMLAAINKQCPPSPTSTLDGQQRYIIEELWKLLTEEYYWRIFYMNANTHLCEHHARCICNRWHHATSPPSGKAGGEVDTVGVDEILVACPLNESQRRLYDTYLAEHVLPRLLPKPCITSEELTKHLIQLRKICNYYSNEGLYSELVSCSGGKLQATVDIVKTVGTLRRIAVITPHLVTLDAIEEVLTRNNIPVARIDIANSAAEPNSSGIHSSTIADGTVYLLSSRDPQLYFRLADMDELIIFDSEWHPTVEKQIKEIYSRIAAAHRTSGRGEFGVHRLFCQDTVEERLLRLLTQRRHQGNTVKTGFTKKLFQQMDLRDLLFPPESPNSPTPTNANERSIDTSGSTTPAHLSSHEPFRLRINQQDWERAISGSENAADISALRTLIRDEGRAGLRARRADQQHDFFCFYFLGATIAHTLRALPPRDAIDSQSSHILLIDMENCGRVVPFLETCAASVPRNVHLVFFHGPDSELPADKVESLLVGHRVTAIKCLKSIAEERRQQKQAANAAAKAKKAALASANSVDSVNGDSVKPTAPTAANSVKKRRPAGAAVRTLGSADPHVDPFFTEFYDSVQLRKWKNAADFLITLYASAMHTLYPMRVPIWVVSQDRGLRYVAQLLRVRGRVTKKLSLRDLSERIVWSRVARDLRSLPMSPPATSPAPSSAPEMPASSGHPHHHKPHEHTVPSEEEMLRLVPRPPVKKKSARQLLKEQAAAAAAAAVPTVPLIDVVNMTADGIIFDRVRLEANAASQYTEIVSREKLRPLSVSFRGHRLGPDGAREAVRLAAATGSVEVLDLRATQIIDGGAKHVADFLRTNMTVTSLDLRGAIVETDGAIALANALTHNTTLLAADFRWNSFGVAGALAFAEMLRTNRTLTSLNIRRNAIGAEGLIAICRALIESNNSSLTALDVRDAKGGDSGAEAIAELIDKNTVLTSLDLSGQGIGPIGAVRIAQALQRNRTLISLSIDYNRIGVDGASAFGEMLRTNQTLTCLTMSRSGLGPRGAQRLAEGLRTNPVLTQLELHKNDLRDVGVIAIADALRCGIRDRRCVDSDDSGSAIVHLGLKLNEIEDAGMAAIGGLATESDTLAVIDIKDNHIGVDGLVAFVDAAKHNRRFRLQQLDLEGNPVGDHGVATLVDVYSQVDTTHLSETDENVLMVLDLTDADIRDDGAFSLGTLLTRSNQHPAVSPVFLKMGRNLLGNAGEHLSLHSWQSGCRFHRDWAMEQNISFQRLARIQNTFCR